MTLSHPPTIVNSMNRYYRPFKPQTEADNLYARKTRHNNSGSGCSEAEALVHQITQELSAAQVDNAAEHVAELLEVCFRFCDSIGPRWVHASPAGKSKVWRDFKEAVANQLSEPSLLGCLGKSN